LHAITPAQSAALIAAFAITIQSVSLWKVPHAIKLTRLMPFLVGSVLGTARRTCGAMGIRDAHENFRRRRARALQYLQLAAAETARAELHRMAQ
jgi:hypothetical protein